MLKSLKKLVTLPGPKELGLSKYDALGCKSLTPFQDGPTWDDWEKLVKAKHPVKYFLVETVPSFVKPAWWKMEAFGYWVKCHTLPSYRWHKLDLRGVDPLSDYTHGYMDPCGMMQLAAWATLRNYVEKELNQERYENLSEEDLADQFMVEQKRQRYDEPMALYRYWMEGRREEKAEHDRLYKLTEVARKAAMAGTCTREEYDAVCTPWLDHGNACELREQEMFMKLCALREYLWT